MLPYGLFSDTILQAEDHQNGCFHCSRQPNNDYKMKMKLLVYYRCNNYVAKEKMLTEK